MCYFINKFMNKKYKNVNLRISGQKYTNSFYTLCYIGKDQLLI